MCWKTKKSNLLNATKLAKEDLEVFKLVLLETPIDGDKETQPSIVPFYFSGQITYEKGKTYKSKISKDKGYDKEYTYIDKGLHAYSSKCEVVVKNETYFSVKNEKGKNITLFFLISYPSFDLKKNKTAIIMKCHICR